MPAEFNAILPATVDIRALQLQSNQSTIVTTSLSGRSQVRSFGGQFWSGQVDMPPMTETETRKIYGFLISKRGAFTSFTIAPANLTTVTGTQSASEALSAGNSVGGRTVTTVGSNEFGIGDMIKFSGPTNHNKAYMVTACSGNTLTFEPGLTAVVTASHTVESKENFELTVRLDGDVFGYDMGPDRFSNLKFKFFEAV